MKEDAPSFHADRGRFPSTFADGARGTPSTDALIASGESANDTSEVTLLETLTGGGPSQ